MLDAVLPQCLISPFKPSFLPRITTGHVSAKKLKTVSHGEKERQVEEERTSVQKTEGETPGQERDLLEARTHHTVQFLSWLASAEALLGTTLSHGFP